MNRRAALAAALAALLSRSAGAQVVLSPNPGDCAKPLVRTEASIARDLFSIDLVSWATAMSEVGVSRAYVLLDPKHAALMPKRGAVKFAGVHFLVQVAPEPLPPNPFTGEETSWTALAECGVIL